MIKPAFVEQFCPTPIRRLMTCSFGSFGEPIGPRAQEWHTTGSGLQLSTERERDTWSNCLPLFGRTNSGAVKQKQSIGADGDWLKFDGNGGIN